MGILREHDVKKDIGNTEILTKTNGSALLVGVTTK